MENRKICVSLLGTKQERADDIVGQERPDDSLPKHTLAAPAAVEAKKAHLVSQKRKIDQVGQEMIRKTTLAQYVYAQGMGADTLSAAKRLIRRKQIEVNGVTVRHTDYELKPDDVVTSCPERKESGNWEEFNLSQSDKLDIVYEDQHLAIVVKPPGMPVFGPKHTNIKNGHSLKTALLTNIERVTDGRLNPLHRPIPVHRLDLDTHGLVLCAKTRVSLR